MSISALDKETARILRTSQIITSVSTATKELIENALDAGGQNIEINLLDNGCSLIEVKDDGCGISKVNAPYVALQNYTSKLSNFSDLETLETYGFRGEALYALSSISDVTIVTKTAQDEVASSYTIDHSGNILKSELCHRPTGTTVQVRELFKLIPVRRQIIKNPKKSSQDVKALKSMIISYAMCKYSVRIFFKVDKNIVFSKVRANTLEEAVQNTLGTRVTGNMSWIDVTDTDIKIKMMVPSKETANVADIVQSDAQYIFVNDRPVKQKELEKIASKIIMEGIGQDPSSKKKPIFVIYILLNAANIDVNLEPNKTTILFKEKNVIFDTIQKHLDKFYGIPREVQEDCDISFADYQDYSQKTNTDNIESVPPTCKKRKVETEENIEGVVKEESESKNVTHRLNFVDGNNVACNEEMHDSTNERNREDETGEKRDETVNRNLNGRLPPLDLSESDSNDSQYNNMSVKEMIDDSPQFELTPSNESLDKLPYVDLGDDFEMIGENKENKMNNLNVGTVRKENNSDTKNVVTLQDWSKGHVSNLKGGTDVIPLNRAESNELSESDTHTNACKGFAIYSERVRPEVMGKFGDLTAAQCAQTITTLWKNLSPEERGYYRDLARDRELERKEKRNKAAEKEAAEKVKTKNRLLEAIGKMNFNMTQKQNLVLRTTVPWNIDIEKVTDNYQNKSIACNQHPKLVVGPVGPNLWITHRSDHIWILDSRNLKKKLQICDTDTSEDDAETVEHLLQQWFSRTDDLSLLHPVHALSQITNS
ncbi:PMS1 protein homolog 1-like isoform X2 [Ceratina calcarata]|uniref:PMS1 protein homolog 1-like isoform X2 n=1 Tax=Ceratina calcarata TaxID=156304 RepID=A0AAJ7W836_9HYME|nr:PMS1 protein homolog 1-like isoform X2 [Ceratina calcarata]